MKNFIKNNTLELSIIALIVIRLIVMAWLPLLDKTEARYGEIARIMYQTGNWVTPQIDYGVPFWAKPPLSTWWSAISYYIFGVNEFAARLPSFIFQLLLVYVVAKSIKLNSQYTKIFALIMLTIPEFYLHCGVVSTDAALLVGVTLVMIGFWNSIHLQEKTKWNLMTWLGVAIGLLAKGPIVLILTVPPLFIWACFNKENCMLFFKKAFWLPGWILVTIISIPWFYLAEIRTPGFIDYFFIGEHYKRFFESGWKGDKYGFAKQQPMGMIWLFLFLFSMPWIQFVIVKLSKLKKQLFADSWALFLVLWMLWTPLFFTVSKSLIHTYTLPSTIPLGLLVLHWFSSFKTQKNWWISASVLPTLVALALIVLNVFYTNTNWHNTDKFLLQKSNPQKPVYSYLEKSYSAQFYTNGQIKLLHNFEELQNLINKNQAVQVVIEKKDFDELPVAIKSQSKIINENNKKYLVLL